MQILLVSNYYPEHVGGVESLAATLAAGYRQHGHQVRWLAGDIRARPHAGHADDVPLRVWNGIERAGFPYPVPGPGGLVRVSRHVAWSDVVHMHDCLYAANLATFFAARRHRRPLLITQHVAEVPYSNPLLQGLQSVAYSTLGQIVLSGADQVAFETQEVLRWFEGRVRFRRPPILIENGIDTELFRAASDQERRRFRANLGIDGDRPLVLFVGRFVEKKGIQLLRPVVEATRDWSWLFIGRAGDVDPAAWRLPNVRVLSPLSHPALRDHYVAADLLALPSIGEGFPVVAQEAMSCGTPVLLSAQTARGLPAIRELVFTTSREPADLHSALLHAVATVLRDPGWRARVATLARERWASGYYVRAYEMQLQRLMG